MPRELGFGGVIHYQTLLVDPKKLFTSERKQTTIDSMYTRRSGFTLLELLIVIAIIAILSAVINATFGDTRDQARDAKIKRSLSSMRNTAEEVYTSVSPNSYQPVCFETMVDLTNAHLPQDGSTQNYQCLSTKDAWVAIFPLYQGGYWCSDGLGRSIAVSGFVEYTASQYMDCLQATASDPNAQAPPSEEIDPEGTGSSDIPTITLYGDSNVSIYSPSNNPFTGNAWHKYYEPGYAATDDTDGDITEDIVTIGPTFTGSNTSLSCPEYYYDLVYTVTNSGGNSAAQATRNITHHRCQAP